MWVEQHVRGHQYSWHSSKFNIGHVICLICFQLVEVIMLNHTFTQKFTFMGKSQVVFNIPFYRVMCHN